MTQYESTDTILSLVAIVLSILIPVIQHIYRRLQRPYLEIIPFDLQPLTLNYDKLGHYASFRFSIQCERESCIVKSISLQIKRLNGEVVYSEKWVLLKPIFANWVFTGMQQATVGSATLVHPVKIDAGKLEPMNAEFKATGGLSHANLMNALGDAITRANPESSTLDDVLSDRAVCVAMENVAESCPWVEGDYQAEMNVRYDANGLKSQRYRFSIDESQAELLRLNSKVLAANCATAETPGDYIPLQTLSLDVATVD